MLNSIIFPVRDNLIIPLGLKIIVSADIIELIMTFADLRLKIWPQLNKLRSSKGFAKLIQSFVNIVSRGVCF